MTPQNLFSTRKKAHRKMAHPVPANMVVTLPPPSLSQNRYLMMRTQNSLTKHETRIEGKAMIKNDLNKIIFKINKGFVCLEIQKMTMLLYEFCRQKQRFAKIKSFRRNICTQLINHCAYRYCFAVFPISSDYELQSSIALRSKMKDRFKQIRTNL